jgi:hypothetical protein
VQFTFLDSDNAFRQPFALHLALAQDEIETRALGAAVVEVDPGPQRAGNRQLQMLELSQLRDQRQDRSRLDTVDRQVEIEHVPVGEIAVFRMQLRHAGADRRGQRKIASDALAAAFDGDIDPLGPPALPAPLIVEDDSRAANAEPLQEPERCVRLPRASQLLEHLRSEVGGGVVGAREPRRNRPARIANEVHDRALDDQSRRHQLTMQQLAQPKARRDFRQARQRPAVGQR